MFYSNLKLSAEVIKLICICKGFIPSKKQELFTLIEKSIKAQHLEEETEALKKELESLKQLGQGSSEATEQLNQAIE